MSTARDDGERMPYRSQYRPAQKVLNESWPFQDRAGRHARGIPDQLQPIEVDVRVVLDGDGEQWLSGSAQRWTATHVYVSCLSDSRFRANAVWVRASDVRRVGVEGEPAGPERAAEGHGAPRT